MMTDRQYRDEADYAAMRGLLRTIYATGAPEYCTVGDLDWWRGSAADPNAVAAARLWWDDDNLVGIAWPEDQQIDLMTHPQYKFVEDAMLTWAENQLATSAEADAPNTLTAWAFTSDDERITILQRRGYTQGSGLFLNHRRELDDIPSLSLPDGYRIRHVQSEADLAPRVEVHRAAFAPSRMTVEKHRRVMSLPTYCPELDLVVVAPDETFAAFCILWYDEANRAATFEPVGCHPDHQRRGLSSALLYAGMRRVKQLGASVVHVNSHDEPAAAGLYRRVGFQVLDRNIGWQKRVRL